MTSTLDDEDLSISISQASARRGSRDQREVSTSNAIPPTPKIPKAGTPRSSQRLGQYNIVKTLGEGSFGKVKLAIHGVSGQQVALKIISRRKLITRDMAGRIEREIQYLQLLRHPHIIKLYTVITTPSEIIMVLEYAGGELFDYIVQNGKMPEDKARKFFQQIVCAVEYCHRHKIVHRDLKPENLLLDSELNVKIADFGLSNIMTDGNFLKTSCGSPNYAAPEVISGKLYAGPEVDVWSCGVILYVLLVGRLPFDDEYIPALFRKIAQGQYAVPSYLSQGAVRLIRKILQVNPMNRITIQEIRSDPWFTKDLPDYLQPPVEEFVDTGVDPNKAIDPHSIAKGKPAVIQEKLHASVVGKLGKTMGYAPDDVQEALAKDEPSAIKDAYLIVRENQLMKTNPSLAADQPAFMAQSPPPFSTSVTVSNSALSAPRIAPSPLGNVDHPRQESNPSVMSEPKSPATTIAILPSSLPEYHAAYMKGQVNKSASPTLTDESKADPNRPRTKEEQAETAKRLKPHSKSSTNLHRHAEKPEPMTSIPDKQAKKPRATKWQFGIRSRNSPAEAMLAIYKALLKMGAEWEEPKPKEPGAGSGEASPEASHHGSAESVDSAGNDRDYATHSDQESRRQKKGKSDEEERRGRERYGRWNDFGYSIPEDPWVINARFLKTGMLPTYSANPPKPPQPTASQDVQTSSTSQESTPRQTPKHVTKTSDTSTGKKPKQIATGQTVYVYVTIQLYSIEKDFYLVDFKCAGYERLVKRFAAEVNDGRPTDIVKHVDVDKEKSKKENKSEDNSVVQGADGEEYTGEGRNAEEKDITSPYPFLDVASRLIIALAEAND